MQLRGVPRLNGILRPHASIETPVADEWEEFTETIELGQARRVERLGTRRWRGRWTVGYEALTQAEALALRSDLLADTLLWCPRTRAEGDPDGLAEVEVEAYLASSISTLNPLWRRAADGTEYWELRFELASVEAIPAVPNTATGGFYLINAQDGQTAEIEPYGGATAVQAVYTVTFQGVTYTRSTAALGPDLVALARTEPAGERTALLTTTAPPSS